jgi:hypothetical protein
MIRGHLETSPTAGEMSKVTSPAPERRNGLQPILEAVLVVQHLAHGELGVLVLGAPEQGVERAHLDTDPAVHAQGVVDVEAVEGGTHLDPATRLVGRLLFLVALDVDAPVGAVAGAQHADGAGLLVEGDDPASPGDRGLLLLGVVDRCQVLPWG